MEIKKENQKKIPKWFLKSSVYQINPRTFSAEGTIKAVTKELPFLAELGFSIMYLCPVFKEDASEKRDNWSNRQKKSGTGNPKNPYRIEDYFETDDEFGNMSDIKEFVEKSHEFGMKVILDLVYMHCAPSAKLLKQHSEFAQHDEKGQIIFNDYHFPLLDFSCEGLREYLWCNMTYYVSALDVDGFRCDVGDAVPLDFWAEGKRRIQAIKPEAIMINEGFNINYLTDVFDAMYGVIWCWNLHDVAIGEKSLSELQTNWLELENKLPSHGVLLRCTDNHDTVTDWPERTESVVGHDGMEMLIAMNYFIDGIPMIYCGNELADTARLSMFANRFYMGEFEVTDRNNKTDISAVKRINVIKKLNDIRKNYKAVSYGNTKWLDCSYPEKIAVFKRIYENETVIFAANINKDKVNVTLDNSINGETIIYNKTEIISEKEIALESYGYIAIRLKNE